MEVFLSWWLAAYFALEHINYPSDPFISCQLGDIGMFFSVKFLIKTKGVKEFVNNIKRRGFGRN